MIASWAAARAHERRSRSYEEGMSHDVYRVVSFSIAGPYTLDVTFDDGTSRRINFEPVLVGELYGPLKDRRLFDAVKLDPEVHTLVWPKGP
jgi:hypothetical protein